MINSDALDASLREAFGRVVYSHTTHVKMINQLNTAIHRWRWAQIVILSLTTGGVITNLFQGTVWVGILAAIGSALSLAMIIYQLSFNYERAVQEHRRAATRLWGIREEYENLIADLQDAGINPEAARAKRDEITRRLQEIYTECPDTTTSAFKAARRALKWSDEMTFSNEEVDQFLPEALRRYGKHQEPSDLVDSVGLRGQGKLS
jgi:hypothetical protein